MSMSVLLDVIQGLTSITGQAEVFNNDNIKSNKRHREKEQQTSLKPFDPSEHAEHGVI
jgi:hypothetical protein